MRRLILALVATTLGACANPYQTYYRPNGNVPPDARQMPGYAPMQGPLQIYSTDDIARDVRAMRIKGWFVVGSSFFYGPGNKVTDAALRSQAERVGASAVLLSTKYKDTVSGAVPLTLPNNTTSYTTGTATAYGPGGVVNAYSNATTTTYGTTTTMLPYSVSRNDYGAVFFIRLQQRLGIYPRPLTDAERQMLQTNGAVGVDFVVEGSNAFRADVFPGDFALSIAGQQPGGPEDFLNIVKQHQGQQVDLTLRRGDQTLTKRVAINSY
jgi:hypothetical protein